MSVISVQDATSTRDCKTPGCPNEAEDRRGPYALLCRSCKFRARQAKAQGREAASATEKLNDALYGAAGETPEPPLPPEVGAVRERPAAAPEKPKRARRARAARAPKVVALVTLEERVGSLAEAARRLDTARAALAGATAEVALAEAAWRELLAELAEDAA